MKITEKKDAVLVWELTCTWKNIYLDSSNNIRQISNIYDEI